MRLIGTITPDFVVPVSRLANYLSRKLAADAKLRRIGVSGEISGLAPQANGTVYFDLKDRDAVIRCVAWSEAAASFPLLANGLAVIAVGSVGVYAKRTTLQLTVYAIELEGAGRLHALYEALKRRLEAEGLFAERRKRALPAYPFHVALVSSKSANGAGDFLAQAAALAPHVTIELFETPVQGANAAPDIVRAIDRASRSRADLVVLARGGGSYEDLFVFNDERVVRALARCAHPTVSAIGHEADAPLTDFVADRRASTPSTAVQTLLPRRTDVLRHIAQAAQRLARAASRNVGAHQRDFERIEQRSPLTAPESFLGQRRAAVDTSGLELHRAVAAQLGARRHALTALGTRLEAANPNIRLSRRRELLSGLHHRLQQASAVRLRREAHTLAKLGARLQASNPSLRLSRSRERVALASFALDAAGRRALEGMGRRSAQTAARIGPAVAAAGARRTARLRLLEAQLDGRNPTAILQRGYAIVSHAGRILRDPAAVEPGAQVIAQLARGTLAARVEAVSRDGGE
jgi:exodeoxyribonuclease VII large subunit